MWIHFLRQERQEWVWRVKRKILSTKKIRKGPVMRMHALLKQFVSQVDLYMLFAPMNSIDVLEYLKLSSEASIWGPNNMFCFGSVSNGKKSHTQMFGCHISF